MPQNPFQKYLLQALAKQQDLGHICRYAKYRKCSLTR